MSAITSAMILRQILRDDDEYEECEEESIYKSLYKPQKKVYAGCILD